MKARCGVVHLLILITVLPAIVGLAGAPWAGQDLRKDWFPEAVEAGGIRVDPHTLTVSRELFLPIVVRSYRVVTPGILIKGRTTLIDGGGLPEVLIYVAVATGEGGVVTTTDQDGFYQYDLVLGTHIETVRVWAERSGYTFDPPIYWLMHYGGYQVVALDFVAIP
jgi:hypothetical protein